MKRLLLLLGLFLALPLPASAQTSSVQTRVLAEVTQSTLPAGPLTWQAHQALLESEEGPLVTGQDIGFTFVVDGALSYQAGESAPRLMVAGEAAATVSGLARRLAPVDLTGAVYWYIGLGGPTTTRVRIPPVFLFQSEPLDVGSAGPFVARMSETIVTGDGQLAAESSRGTRTVFVMSGPARLRIAEGGATLRPGDSTTVPAGEPLTILPLTEEPTRLLVVTLLQTGAPAPIATPRPAGQPTQSGPSFPLLPNGFFPRANP